MKYILTERQYNRLLEQAPRYMNPEAASNVVSRLNPHTVMTILTIGSAFIPLVGPFLSAGFGLADAYMYSKEGKNKEAAVVAIFSLLPGIGAVVSKIPGIKQLGAKGMSALATKILSSQALNSVEMSIADGLALNQVLVKTELNQVAKNMASSAIEKVSNEETKEFLKHVAEKGVEHASQHQAVHLVGNKKS